MRLLAATDAPAAPAGSPWRSLAGRGGARKALMGWAAAGPPPVIRGCEKAYPQLSGQRRWLPGSGERTLPAPGPPERERSCGLHRLRCRSRQACGRGWRAARPPARSAGHRWVTGDRPGTRARFCGARSRAGAGCPQCARPGAGGSSDPCRARSGGHAPALRSHRRGGGEGRAGCHRCRGRLR